MLKTLQTLVCGLITHFYIKVLPLFKRKLVNGKLPPFQQKLVKIESKVIKLAAEGNPKLMKKINPNGYILYLMIHSKQRSITYTGFNNFRFRNRTEWEEDPEDVEEGRVFSKNEVNKILEKFGKLLEETISVNQPLCILYPGMGEVVSVGINDDYEELLTCIAKIKNRNLSIKISEYLGFKVSG